MRFLIWLEASGFAEWVRSSLSGYPLMIASHAIGMAIMVGIAFGLDMRLLGLFRGIPYMGLNRFLALAWAGFAINFLSGAGLFAAQATTYIRDATFLLKMAFVLAGVVLTALLQRAVARNSQTWSRAAAPAGIRLVAVGSVVCWVGATLAGRLIAYI